MRWIWQLSFFCLFIISASSLPSTIIVIRHGEKDAIPGKYLNATGWERAGALIGYFGGMSRISSDPELNQTASPSIFSPPFAIHASKPNESFRPLQTAIPLANALQLTVQTDFPGSEVKKLAKQILTNPNYDGKEILIVYPHGKIPKLVQELILQAGGSPLKLAHYPSDRYDLVYVLQMNGSLPQLGNLPYRRVAAGESITLTLTLEQILYQDSEDLPPSPFPLQTEKNAH